MIISFLLRFFINLETFALISSLLLYFLNNLKQEISVLLENASKLLKFLEENFEFQFGLDLH